LAAQRELVGAMDPKDWNPLLLLIVVVVGMFVMHKINNLYFGWLHRRSPSLFRPRALLIILGICVAVVVVLTMLILPDIHKLTGKAH
jgi:hypothetical protein